MPHRRTRGVLFIDLIRHNSHLAESSAGKAPRWQLTASRCRRATPHRCSHGACAGQLQPVGLHTKALPPCLRADRQRWYPISRAQAG